MKRLSFLIVAILLAGCAQQKNWTKEGVATSQLEKDKMACALEAKKATPDDGLSIGARYLEIESLCMQTKGYRG